MLNYLNWLSHWDRDDNGTLIMGQRGRCTGFYWERWWSVLFFSTCILFFCQEWSKTPVEHLFACLTATDPLILGQNRLPDQGRAPYVVISPFFLSLQNLSAGYWVIGWPGGHHPWENAAAKLFFFSCFQSSCQQVRSCTLRAIQWGGDVWAAWAVWWRCHKRVVVVT